MNLGYKQHISCCANETGKEEGVTTNPYSPSFLPSSVGLEGEDIGGEQEANVSPDSLCIDPRRNKLYLRKLDGSQLA